MISISAVILVLQIPRLGSGVSGTIRAAEDGGPLFGAIVVEIDSHRWTVSDSGGRYSLADLVPGPHRLRFVRAGRVTLELTALLREGVGVRLDVELGPQVAKLAPLVVSAPLHHDPVSDAEVAPVGLGPEWAQTVIPGPADVQNVLTNLPGAATRGDATGSLNFQGGESDQAGILIDGFPVLGAAHFGGSQSAINPDLVQRIEVRMGAPPARFGGWLSGTVLLQSTLLAPDREHARGGVNPTDVRQLLRGAFLGGQGRFLLSGRRSFRSPWNDPAVLESGNGYEDWLGTAAVPLGNGSLQLLVFKSRNQLAFPSRNLDESVAAGSQSNNLEWSTGTVGGAWQGSLPHRGTLGLRAWRANVGSAVEWQSPTTGVALDSRFTESGVRADGSLPLGQGAVEFGVGLTEHRSRFLSGPLGAGPSLSVLTGTTSMHGYLERRWRLGGILSARAGLRANYTLPGWVGIEPRIGAEFHLAKGVRAAINAGRIYQFSQSLRNHESFLSSVVTFDLPAGIGTAGLPVASADNGSLTVEISPDPSTILGVRGYLRRFNGLVLAAGSTAQPFLTGAAEVGSGTASGVELRLTHVGGSIRVDAAVATAAARRELKPLVEYRPAFLRTVNVSAQIGAALDSLTTIGLAFQAGNGQPTTLVGSVEWKPYDPLSGGELLGTPDNLDAGVNQRRLPGVARVDLGVSRRFRLSWRGGLALATASVALENLLNRRNPLALSASTATGVPLTLFARPRTLRVEVGWRF